MLAFGYMGETEVMSIWPAFFASLLCWSYIVWEVFFGQASQLASLLTLEAALRYLKKVANTPETKDFEKPAAAKAFDRLRLILLLGWSLYPLRPVLLRFIWPEIIPTTSSQGTTPESSGIGSEESLNALYNLGDLVNKIFFGIAVWTAAGSEEETTHQQVYRVQRREAEIITSWMEQLRMRNIVHKNFRGTLPAWLDLELRLPLIHLCPPLGRRILYTYST
ncbi:unnamed protein product [Amoebophrya sp. A25]|nr:unnamed protein product [Amoebophrya sp. A25]|eukprot:GSA25T00021341001.1